MPVFFFLFAVLLALPVAWPGVDLLASGLFYRAGAGFFLADNPGFVALHWVAYYGARVMGVVFVVFAVAAMLRRTGPHPLAPAREGRGRIAARLFPDAKAWLFLLLALIVGPGLIANAGFKDHWGRARPREVVEFGGAAQFSPALVPQSQARRNESFVSGDGAFGFFLPTFAYVAPRRRARRVFWGCMGAGGLFGFVRLAMGAHFLSDILYAAFFVLAASAAVHAAMYGKRETAARWRMWFAALGTQ